LGGFEIVPRQGDDLALSQPANRRNLQLGLTLVPESFEKHFFTTKDCFLQIARWPHFREVFVLLYFSVLGRNLFVRDVYSLRQQEFSQATVGGRRLSMTRERQT
jgi:hypothetical protein